LSFHKFNNKQLKVKFNLIALSMFKQAIQVISITQRLIQVHCFVP